MTDEAFIEMVAGPMTPDHLRHHVGERVPIVDGAAYPAPGSRGRLWDVPGVMLDGSKWEICEVDMRTKAEKLMDEAAEILALEPEAGERVVDIQTRHLRAEHLMLRARLAMLRSGR